MNDYLMKIKSLIDSLDAIGSPLAFSDHLNEIFRGLPYEYVSFVCSMFTRVDSNDISNVESLLWKRFW